MSPAPRRKIGGFFVPGVQRPRCAAPPAERQKDNILLWIIKTIQKKHYFFLFFTCSNKKNIIFVPTN